MGIPANAIHAVIKGHLAGGEIFNAGFWFQAAAAMSQAALDDAKLTIGNAFTTNLQAAMLACLTATSGVDKISCYGYAGGSSAAYVSEYQVNAAGTTASGVLPVDSAFVVSLRTGRPGRSYRGRVYLPCTTKTLSGHQIQTADVDVLTNAVKNFLSSCKAGGAGFTAEQPVVVSPHLSTLTPITQVQGDSLLDVQRRRQQRVVANYTKVAAV